ncbi:hypothetical protein O6H91_22G027700 [Diphasiastrum complanatum]|uniref:Uncharacterized protein n=1 Tax=Diphasiastrum complanatum TaxID=34168 RepID=A0ACC2AE55_DIPCM|nr:hypothetical protein O6H91_22G027700 [Diphasiastrum complanatum]
MEVSRPSTLNQDCMSLQLLIKTFTYPELHRVLEAWPQNWHKTDKLGRPVNIQLLSRLKLSDVFQATTEDRLLMRAMWVWEELHECRLPACSTAAGSYIGQATVIFDLHNVSVSTFTNVHVRRILSKMANLFSRYYPDYLGRLIIINVPVAFWVVWEMLRPFINDRTQKKIRIHRGNGLEDLLNTIHAEDLPSFLGGRCRCPGGCEHALTGP